MGDCQELRGSSVWNFISPLLTFLGEGDRLLAKITTPRSILESNLGVPSEILYSVFRGYYPHLFPQAVDNKKQRKAI